MFPLDHFNFLFHTLVKTLLDHFQLAKADTANLLAHQTGWSTVTLILISFHCLPVQNTIQFKGLVITLKALHCQGPDGISDETQQSETVCAVVSYFAPKSRLNTKSG